MSLLLIKGKHHFTAPGVFLGYILMCAGLFIGVVPTLLLPGTSIVGHLLIGLIIIFLGFVFTTTKEVFLLDTTNREYCKSTFFLGSTFGERKSLPEIEKVKVSPVKSNYSIVTYVSPSVTLSENKFRVMLFVKNSVRGIIVSDFSKDKARIASDLLAESLGVHVEEEIDV